MQRKEVARNERAVLKYCERVTERTDEAMRPERKWISALPKPDLRGAKTRLVSIERGKHLFPYRTQQLSLSSVTILGF
jgi:hypothetical protein